MGALYLVPTPIGNLDDITLRAVKILTMVDTVLCEDTRVSGKLLRHLEINTDLRAYHDHNKERVTHQLIGELHDGKNMALITDAGSPAIADPGYFIVRRAIAEKIPVVPLPGATALIPALTASGLAPDRFIFENFLPPKSGRRKRFFESLKEEKRTVIFYETPHRITKVLGELEETLPHAAIALCREITKIHEEFLRGTPSSIIANLGDRKLKGEIVVLINAPFKDPLGIFR
ncbi:MAG: 16S rRNA (cytidine(1402)-2'-O)-methyltransferase [Fibrobacterota bacterium]